MNTWDSLSRQIKDKDTGEVISNDTRPIRDVYAQAMMAPQYEALTFPVTAGQHCIYEGALYIAAQAIDTAEEWTAAHWTQVVLGSEVTDLKSQMNVVEETIYNTQKSAAFWEQGYWAIVDGTKKAANDWIRTPDFLTDDKVYINAPSTYYMYLMAYDGSNNDTYIGAWDQTNFVKTYTANTGLHSIDLNSFKTSYPTYKYKISLVVNFGTNITPSNTGANVEFLSRIDFNGLVEEVNENSSVIEGAFDVLKMGQYYENFEVSAGQNSYTYYPNTGTPNLTRARIKQEYIQAIPDGATLCTVTLGADIFANGKYKVGFAFYSADYKQRLSSVVGWLTSATSFTATPASGDKYYMLYIATNSAQQVDLSDLTNSGCSVTFNTSDVNYLNRERMAFQYVSGISQRVYQSQSDSSFAKSMGVTALSNVRVINHRGYNVVAPENTLIAFEMSASNGYKYVETDVLFTAPDQSNPLGVPVLLHDASINRTARNADGSAISGTVNIADITYAQALEYDFGIYKGAAYAGTKIPTFDAFIKTCKRFGLHPYIELKNEKTYSQDEVDMILSIIVANGMKKNVSFISFDAAALTLVKNRWDWVELGINSSAGISACQELMTANNDVFVTHNMTSSIVAFMEAEIPACPYTVDTVAQLQALNPYYSMILTDGLTPIQVYDNMFASE